MPTNTPDTQQRLLLPHKPLKDLCFTVHPSMEETAGAVVCLGLEMMLELIAAHCSDLGTGLHFSVRG